MSLKGKTVLFFAGPLYEDLELWYPKIRLEEEGAATTVAGLGEKTYAGKRGYPVTVDTSATDVDAADFDGLVIPGGFAPDQLRRHEAVLRITREIFQAGKPLAFICHAGWVPISAKILKGKRATSVRAHGGRPGHARDAVERGVGLEDERNVVVVREHDDTRRAVATELGEPLDAIHARRDAPHLEPRAPLVDQLRRVAAGTEHDPVRRQDGQSGIVARHNKRQYPVGPGVLRGEGDRGLIAMMAVGDVERRPTGERRELGAARPGDAPHPDAHPVELGARRR